MSGCDVLVVGAGAVGGYFGARLQQAGRSVRFLARGENLAILQRYGLELASISGDLRLERVVASASYEAPEPARLVLVAVKAWQLPAAAELIRPALGPDTLILPLCNGALSSAELAELLPGHTVLAGCCAIYVRRRAPAVLEHFDGKPLIQYGVQGAGSLPEPDPLAALFEGCVGVDTQRPTDIQLAIWRKFLFISAVSSVGAAVREPFGAWRELAEARALCRQAMQEVVAVAQAQGVGLSAGMIERALDWLDASPADAMPSLQRDVLDGRPSELAAQTWAVLDLGRRLGVATPVYEHLWGVLAPGEQARRRGHGGTDGRL